MPRFKSLPRVCPRCGALIWRHYVHLCDECRTRGKTTTSPKIRLCPRCSATLARYQHVCDACREEGLRESQTKYLAKLKVRRTQQVGACRDCGQEFPRAIFQHRPDSRCPECFAAWKESGMQRAAKAARMYEYWQRPDVRERDRQRQREPASRERHTKWRRAQRARERAARVCRCCACSLGAGSYRDTCETCLLEEWAWRRCFKREVRRYEVAQRTADRALWLQAMRQSPEWQEVVAEKKREEARRYRQSGKENLTNSFLRKRLLKQRWPIPRQPEMAARFYDAARLLFLIRRATAGKDIAV